MLSNQLAHWKLETARTIAYGTVRVKATKSETASFVRLRIQSRRSFRQIPMRRRNWFECLLSARETDLAHGLSQ